MMWNVRRSNTEGRVRDLKGGALVEFAIVLPLFLVVLFGVLEFGLILYYKGLITHASREGARRGAMYSTPPITDGEIETWVQNYLIGMGITTPPPVKATRKVEGTVIILTVEVDLPYQSVRPNLLGWVGSSRTLRAVTETRLE